jgi:hypothetical protein
MPGVKPMAPGLYTSSTQQLTMSDFITISCNSLFLPA